MTPTIPTYAVSVRQPWAWAIIHAGKDIENRSAAAIKHGIGEPGRIAIHAAQGMLREDYENARSFIVDTVRVCPEPADLLRGGIIGTVTVTGVVSESISPWFFGPRGIVLTEPVPCDFIRCRGALGRFRWEAEDLPPILPAKWMLPKQEQPQQLHLPEQKGLI